MHRLVALSYSPWSEKARWALLHHRVPFRETEYVPMIGVPLLRAFTRRWTGRVTVPAFRADSGELLTDSWEIARWAEAHGQGEPLFPAEHLAGIEAWNAASERIMAAGRALATRRVAGDSEALLEAVPGFVPRSLARPLGEAGVRYFIGKYGLDAGTEAERTEAIRHELLRWRAALGGSDSVAGAFTYAEVAMAVALQFVKPAESRRPRLRPATARCWTLPVVAAELADLLSWRDRVLARHQPPAP